MLNVKECKVYKVHTNKAMVDWLLSLNTNNRNIRWSHVEWLKKNMLEGNFCLTAQGIGISKDGILLDGQHRLIANREAEYKPIDLVICTGLDTRSQMYVDQHAKRSTADILKLALNKTVSAKMAAIATFMVKLRESKRGFEMIAGKPTIDEIHEYMTENAEDMGLITLACGKSVRTGVMAAIWDYGQRYDRNTAYKFGEQVKNGENLVKGDPAWKLRDYINKVPATGGTAILNDYMVGVSACIADAQGRQIELLRGVQNWDALPRKIRKVA
jgi:hypothetical protein